MVRTDALAAHLGVNVQDLPDVLGVGRASLFCCRKGSRPITAKTWLKLEAAEREAGISDKAEAPVSVPHPPPTPDLHAKIADLKERLGKIETLLELLLEQNTTPQTSSPARGKTA